jgi:hypothetical protein
MKPTWESYFRHRVRQDGGCLVWTGSKDSTGYGRLMAAFAPGVRFAHRMSWLLSRGEFDHKLRVLHRCDNPSCVRPEHLFLGTQADNVADMCAKGRARPPAPQFGSKNRQSALHEEDVWAIRHGLLKFGLGSQAAIARDYCVSPMTISRIATNQSHVTLTWPFS